MATTLFGTRYSSSVDSMFGYRPHRAPLCQSLLERLDQMDESIVHVAFINGDHQYEAFLDRDSTTHKINRVVVCTKHHPEGDFAIKAVSLGGSRRAMLDNFRNGGAGRMGRRLDRMVHAQIFNLC